MLAHVLCNLGRGFLVVTRTRAYYFAPYCKHKQTHWENLSERNACIFYSLCMHNGLCRRTQGSWPRLWRGTQADQIWYLGLSLLNEAPIAAFLFVPVLALVFRKGITWSLVRVQRCYCLSCRRFARVSRHRFKPGCSRHRLLLRPFFEGSAVKLPAAGIKTSADNADLTTVEMWSRAQINLDSLSQKRGRRL